MNRRKQFQKANNYALYYGIGKSDILKNYDIAIVEPSWQNTTAIQLLHDSHTLVLAYISVMELASNHPSYPLLTKDDFLYLGEEPLMNADFHTHLLDLRSTRWRVLLRHQIGKLLLHDHYDGIFLDTIGDVEMPQIPTFMQEIQMHAASEIMQLLRTAFTDFIFVQNNGLEKLYLHTQDYLDGICWENPRFHQTSESEWHQLVLRNVRQMKENNESKVFLLLEESPQQTQENVNIAKALVEQHQFLFFQASYQYV